MNYISEQDLTRTNRLSPAKCSPRILSFGTKFGPKVGTIKETSHPKYFWNRSTKTGDMGKKPKYYISDMDLNHNF